MYYKDKQKGFTLIELLVVILIISVISGIMLSSLNIQGAKMKSRDAQRIGDLKKIQTALESYYMDYRYYPASNATGEWINLSNLGDSATVDFRAALLGENYLDVFPEDPTGSTNALPCSADSHSYYYISDESYYRIISIMELDRSVDVADQCSSADLGCAEIPETCYEVTNP